MAGPSKQSRDPLTKSERKLFNDRFSIIFKWAQRLNHTVDCWVDWLSPDQGLDELFWRDSYESGLDTEVMRMLASVDIPSLERILSIGWPYDSAHGSYLKIAVSNTPDIPPIMYCGFSAAMKGSGQSWGMNLRKEQHVKEWELDQAQNTFHRLARPNREHYSLEFVQIWHHPEDRSTMSAGDLYFIKVSANFAEFVTSKWLNCYRPNSPLSKLSQIWDVDASEWLGSLSRHALHEGWAAAENDAPITSSESCRRYNLGIHLDGLVSDEERDQWLRDWRSKRAARYGNMAEGPKLRLLAVLRRRRDTPGPSRDKILAQERKKNEKRRAKRIQDAENGIPPPARPNRGTRAQRDAIRQANVLKKQMAAEKVAQEEMNPTTRGKRSIQVSDALPDRFPVPPVVVMTMRQVSAGPSGSSSTPVAAQSESPVPSRREGTSSRDSSPDLPVPFRREGTSTRTAPPPSDRPRRIAKPSLKVREQASSPPATQPISPYRPQAETYVNDDFCVRDTFMDDWSDADLPEDFEIVSDQESCDWSVQDSSDDDGNSSDEEEESSSSVGGEGSEDESGSESGSGSEAGSEEEQHVEQAPVLEGRALSDEPLAVEAEYQVDVGMQMGEEEELDVKPEVKPEVIEIDDEDDEGELEVRRLERLAEDAKRAADRAREDLLLARRRRDEDALGRQTKRARVSGGTHAEPIIID